MKQLIGFLIVGCLALVGCGKGNNNNPPSGGGQLAIVSISPDSVAIGQQGGVATIAGTNLTGIQSVDMGDGITVTGYVAQNANALDVHFNVSTHARVGTRTITVIATGGTVTGTFVFSVVNNHAPVAVFRVDPPAGSLTTVFTFEASASTDTNQAESITAYHWDFGNGQTDHGKVVTKKFSAIGDYSVTLRVTDNKGAYSQASKSIKVSKNSPPIPNFTVSPDKGGIGTVFHFDGTKSKDPDGRITDYLWNFGDGKKAHGAEVDHQYAKEGNYDATLTLTDNTNQTVESDPVKLSVDKTSEVACAGNGHSHNTIIKGKVVAVEPGNWAVVNFGPGHSCDNLWHKCDDFRRLSPEGFYGIVDKMTDRGNGVLAVHNACPYRWPPSVGEQVFVYYKTCTQNHCP